MGGLTGLGGEMQYTVRYTTVKPRDGKESSENEGSSSEKDAHCGLQSDA